MNRTKVQVLKPFTYAGTDYLEGIVKVPTKAVDGLVFRKLAQRVVDDIDSDAIDDVIDADVPVMSEMQEGRALWALEFLGNAVVDALIDAGYDSFKSIKNASDDELKSIPGIGKATIKKIREIVTTDTATAIPAVIGSPTTVTLGNK